MVKVEHDNLILGINTPTDDKQSLPKARRDVEITEQVYYGKPCFVLKDPTALRYYRLRPPEYTIYRMLDGKTTIEDISKVLSERFPDEEFDAQAVMSFIIMLRGANLLHISGVTDTDYLLKRKKVITRNIFQKIRAEFLFFKIPLFDPDKLLNYMHRYLSGLIYRRFTAILTLLMLAGALALLISDIDKLSQRQPILDPRNLLFFAPALYLIKLIHEFGHGLTSKYFGSEVHEMGILFLVFMPCPYCDVSDSWMVPEKSRRMWITAGGIVVEIVLAGLATYLWWLTESKTALNQFALNVMLAASVNTILFNGNPLLRFDGYYFMMDLVEIPNLKQKGRGFMWYLVQRFVLGVKNAVEPIDVRGREFTVLGYAICSAIYRWFIMVAIVMMVWRFLDPYGWGVIGGILALGCLFSAFVTPVVKFAKYIFTQHHQLNIRLATAIILLVLGCTAIYIVMVQKLEQSVDAQCVLRPAGIHPIYVTQPGFIEARNNKTFVRDGQAVEADQVLLVLSDSQLQYRVDELDLQIQQLETKDALALQQGETAQKAQIDAEVKALTGQYASARYNLDKLTIRSQFAGIVQLRTSEPLANLEGRYMPLQAEIFGVFQPGSFEAVVAINHRDIELISSGQSAKIKLWSLDGEVFESEVVEKPPRQVIKMSSAAFSTMYGGEVATMGGTTREDALEPAENTYELVLPMPSGETRFCDGMVGRAKVIVEEKTLAKAFYLWLITTLKQDIRL